MASKGSKADHSNNKAAAPKVVDQSAKARQDEMSRIRLEREAEQRANEKAYQDRIAEAKAKSQAAIDKINRKILAREATREVARKISERIAVRQWMDEKYAGMEAEAQHHSNAQAV